MKNLIKGLAGVLFILLLSTTCSRDREFYLDSLKEMEETEYRGQKLSLKRIEEIKEGIKRYQKEVDRKVNATSQIGIYYKMLAVTFMQSEMYQEAYINLKEALAIHPENPILFYLSGVCAARLSKATVESEERGSWLEKAETLYKRAVELDPLYSDALYGLAVLLTFELNRPEEAESLLNRLLSRESKNIEAMFLLGNVYYSIGRFEDALMIYDKIARTTRVNEKKKEALANKKRIEEELHGAE